MMKIKRRSFLAYKPKLKQKIDKITLFKRKLTLNKILGGIYSLKNLGIHPLGGELKVTVNNLETRLDTILFRMKLVKTIKSARQLISHGLVEVNSKIIKSSKYIVSPLSSIHVIDKAPFIISSLKHRRKPVDYLTVDTKTRTGIFIRRPTYLEIPINKKLI